MEELLNRGLVDEVHAAIGQVVRIPGRDASCRDSLRQSALACEDLDEAIAPGVQRDLARGLRRGDVCKPLPLARII